MDQSIAHREGANAIGAPTSFVSLSDVEVTADVTDQSIAQIQSFQHQRSPTPFLSLSDQSLYLYRRTHHFFQWETF